MKVLFVFNHKAPYKVSLFNGIAKEIDLTVIFERDSAKDRKKEFYNEKKYNFKSITFKHGYIGRENSLSFKLKEYIKKHHHEFDIIIMNGYSTFTEIIALNYMIKHHIPYVLYINGGIVKKTNFIKRYLKTKFINHASIFFSPGLEADPYLIQYGAKEEKINHYIYSTIYENEIKTTDIEPVIKERILKEYNLPTKGKIFVTSGQFIKRKNNFKLLEIFSLRKESLVIIGDGKEKDKYIKYIKENNIHNIYLVPFLKKSSLLELLSCCDYYITLSKEDIYGHSVNEAFSQGLPVICSMNVISGKKLIKNQVNGYLVNINNFDEIINALNNISTINKNEVIKTAKENTIEKSVAQHIELFKGLINK
ncbi:MAG: glycosyltransferase [Bacilli bacterium]